MKIIFIAVTSATVFLLGFGPPAHSAILATDQLHIPFAPQAPRKALSLQVTSIDPNKPIWVSYTLRAISASERPSGELVLDAAFERILVPLTDSLVLFAADQMNSLPRTGTFGASFEAQVGQRSQEELAEVFGPELNSAIQALSAKKGSILGKTIVKTYAPTGRDEVRLLASFTKASTLQPILLTVVVGQGEIPAESKDAFSQFTKDPNWNEKLLTAAIAFVIAAIYLFRKFRR